MSLEPEHIREYKRVLANLLNVLIDEHVGHLLTLLERIPDDCRELRPAFTGISPPVEVPTHWIHLLRVIKLALTLKQSLLSQYDSFLQAYQKLSGLATRSPDETRLLDEVGKFLYDVDESTGQIERMAQLIMQEMRKGIVDAHGMDLSPGEDFYRMPIDPKAAERLGPAMDEIFAVCHKMVSLERIMQSLERLRKLILGA